MIVKARPKEFSIYDLFRKDCEITYPYDTGCVAEAIQQAIENEVPWDHEVVFSPPEDNSRFTIRWREGIYSGDWISVTRYGSTTEIKKQMPKWVKDILEAVDEQEFAVEP